MPKRLRNDGDGGERSARRKRPSKTVPSTGSATPASTASPSRASSIHSGNTRDKSSSENTLSIKDLAQEVLKMVENEDGAELMILELMRKYSFSLTRLKELLRGKLDTLESLV